MSILGRKVSVKAVVAVAAIFVAVVGLLPVMTLSLGERAQPRQVTLVAKDMAFYLSSDLESANPVIEAKAGERLRVVLRNRDRGITHDFAVPAAEAATGTLSWDEQDEVTFEAPDKPGTYEYVCRPHLLMMKGTLRVTR